tara:strand:+ start:413 stop:757 length:345 start_codon:yes stop_codon:yes gene_type:complete
MNNEIPTIQNLIAVRVLSHAQAKDDSFSFDPFTIMAICNCIISVVKLLYMCYSRDSIASAIKRRSYLHTILLRREVRKNFKDKKQRKVMYKSLAEVGTSLSEMELFNLLDSIQE